MQNLECYDALTKLEACQLICGECNLDCDKCEYFVDKETERQALEYAKVAVQEREIRQNLGGVCEDRTERNVLERTEAVFA